MQCRVWHLGVACTRARSTVVRFELQLHATTFTSTHYLIEPLISPVFSFVCTGLDPCNPANMPFFWHKGRDFIKNGTPVHLIFRMATIGEKSGLLTFRNRNNHPGTCVAENHYKEYCTALSYHASAFWNAPRFHHLLYTSLP